MTFVHHTRTRIPYAFTQPETELHAPVANNSGYRS